MSKTTGEKLTNDRIVFISLAAAVLICYFPAFKNGFTNWDDQEYVLNNSSIHSLSFSSITYLFSHFLVISYHPLTLLSLQINYYFSGTSAFGYIFTNVILHLLNCYLVFRFLREVNFEKRLSFFVALLFAIHPLHVESVAWIAERKDVLYTFFFLLSLIFYSRYLKTQNNKIYLVSLLLFIFSCMSKSQAVTLSLLLFPVDFLMNKKLELKNITNKLPFILVSILFGTLSVVAQGNNVSEFTGTDFTFLQRMAFAAHSYLYYIAHVLSPLKLSAFYPYPSSFNNVYYLFIPISLIVLIAPVYFYRKNKHVLFSLLFFTINIFFLLQLFPVGDAMMADRYTYIPSIGLFILFVLLTEYSIKRFSNSGLLIKSIVVCYFAFLAQTTFARCKVWENGITLWSDVIDKYPHASIAFTNRGANHFESDNTTAALSDFKKAIELDSLNSFARYNAALIYYNNNDFKSSLQILGGVPAGKRTNIDVFLLKAFCENKLQDYYSSARDVETYLSQKKTAEGYTLAGLNKIMTGENTIAKLYLDSALNTDPEYTDAYVKRGVLFFQKGDTISACNDWQKALSAGSNEVEPFLKMYCKK